MHIWFLNFLFFYGVEQNILELNYYVKNLVWLGLTLFSEPYFGVQTLFSFEEGVSDLSAFPEFLECKTYFFLLDIKEYLGLLLRTIDNQVICK